MLAAVSAGGRYVHVENATNRTADLLITSGVPLIFEEVSDTRADELTVEPDWTGRFVDWDYL